MYYYYYLLLECITSAYIHRLTYYQVSQYIVDLPDAKHVRLALANLMLLGALDANGKVTPFGKLVRRLSLILFALAVFEISVT